MALDAYSPCPCGSGKKFKWCCQPIYVQLNKALRQDADGQHETALRTMDELLAEHPSNPEVWGRKAQLLYQNDRVEEAEQALDKAFAINASYPFGYLLRGLFRQQEGELAGALLLFRKAAELYDPEARGFLAQVYIHIAECELKLNRPLAARAAMRICLHAEPNEELQKNFDEIFGEHSRLPASARREYTFQSPPTGAPAARRAAWERALSGASTGRLTDAARAFEQLTQDNPEDGAAWYNLGLVRAWLGDHRTALEALDRSVARDPDEERAAATWTMAEVLRFGQGMEEQADYVEHYVLFRMQQPQVVIRFLQQWEEERRLIGVQVRQEEGVLTGLVLEPVSTLTSAPAPLAKLGAYLLVIGDVVRLWTTNVDSLQRVRQEILQRAGAGLGELEQKRGPANFADVLAEALAFPTAPGEESEIEHRIRDHVERYFEETWLHRPLQSLNRLPPIDAAGHTDLRKKVRGVVQFLQDCAGGAVQTYDFDRLRRKLGLIASPAESPAPAGAAPQDISALNAAELAALAIEGLSDEQLEHAYQTAHKLDARELAGRFAEALVARPPRPERPDQYAVYAYLVQQALSAGDMRTALDHVNAGEKADCENNEGRRRNDYELRRGQILTKQGETDAARDLFERLIERAPGELRYRGSAAEAMLTAKQGTVALRFAEQGLSKAREKNDRDSEQYFLELAAAARRQVG